MTKSIVLCADDYGQAPEVNEGILQLLKKSRLSAVSCLVNSYLWPEAASALLNTTSSADIGLHFNLTEGQALSAEYQSAYGRQFSSLGTLMRRAAFRQLDKRVMQAELLAQLAAFEAAMGRLPAFIDGHQHVHQFPVIRDVVLSVHEANLRQAGSYLRLALPKLAAFSQFKQLVIILMGAMAFKRELEQAGIPHNASFSGSYAFKNATHYQEYFQQFLDEIEDGGLIMCHPACAEVALDPIARARVQEYSYLASDRFVEDCQRRGVKIVQFALNSPA